MQTLPNIFKNKKIRASVSLFMAIIMLSMFVLSAVINDAARKRAARAIIQSAADSAALSVLAKYDIDLKNRYGLFALSDTDKDAVLKDFTNFFLENLASEYPISGDFRKSIENLMSSVGKNVSKGSPFDLYDFQLEYGDGKTALNLAYSIVEPGVLETQMAEFTKYRGFIAAADTIDLSDLNKKAADSMKILDKMDETVDTTSSTEGAGYKDAVQEATKAYYLLSNKILGLGAAMKTVNENIDFVNGKVNSLSSEADGIKAELEEYDRLLGVANEKRQIADSAYTAYSEADTKARTAQTAYENAEQLATTVDFYKNIRDNAGGLTLLFNYQEAEDHFTSDSTLARVWRTEKDYYQNLSYIGTNFTLDEYFKLRTGSLSKTGSPIEKAEGNYSNDVGTFYIKVKSYLNQNIDKYNSQAENGNAEKAASNAKADYEYLNGKAQTLSDDYQQKKRESDDANDALEEQRKKLNRLVGRWNRTVNSIYNSGPFASPSLKDKLNETDNILANEKLRYDKDNKYHTDNTIFPWEDPVFNNVGVGGAVDEIKSSLTDAQTKLKSAQETTRAYIQTIRKRYSSESAEEKAMDEALFSDAHLALGEDTKDLQDEAIATGGELKKIEDDTSNLSPSLLNYLDGTKTYAENADSKIRTVKAGFEELISQSQSSPEDAYSYLKSQIQRVKNYYGGQNGTTVVSSNNEAVSAKNTYINTYNKNGNIYKYYTYVPFKPKKKNGSEYSESSGAGLFSLFKDFNSNDFKPIADPRDKEYGTGAFPDRAPEHEKPGELPSRVYKNYNTYDEFKADDEAYIAEQRRLGKLPDASVPSSENGEPEGFSALDNIEIGNDAKSQSDGFNLLTRLMNSVQSATTTASKALLVDYYDMSMFKSRLTHTPEDWEEIYTEKGVDFSSLKTADYYAKRADADESEKNLFFRQKTDEITYYDSEIEYILGNSLSQRSNEKSIYLKIFGIRLVNNLIAIYQDPDLRNLALYASSFAGPFAPVVQIAIIAVLAVIETYIDMCFLIDYGYKIPFWKTKDNLILSLSNLEDKLSSGEIEKGGIKALINKPNLGNSKFLVTYETYLWFFMLIRDREQKIVRAADLMQMNIRQAGNESYKLADHYTYIRCKAVASFKPTFMGLGFIPGDFSDYKGRPFVTSINYQGY